MNYSRMIPTIAVAGLMAAAACFSGPPSYAQQAPAAKPRATISKAELVSLIDEISAQQKQIAQNLELIDTKTAALEETLRQARLFVARGGGRGRAR